MTTSAASGRTNDSIPASQRGVVRAFRKRVNAIFAAPDERVFYGFRSLHFERLKGQRQHQCSMRLNKQFRLILELDGEGRGKAAKLIAIEDYH
jgi:toxin HigB-1